MVGAKGLQRFVHFPPDALGCHYDTLSAVQHVAAFREKDNAIAVAGGRLQPSGDGLFGTAVTARRVYSVEARVRGGGNQVAHVGTGQHGRNRRSDKDAVRRLADTTD